MARQLCGQLARQGEQRLVHAVCDGRARSWMFYPGRKRASIAWMLGRAPPGRAATDACNQWYAAAPSGPARPRHNTLLRWRGGPTGLWRPRSEWRRPVTKLAWLSCSMSFTPGLSTMRHRTSARLILAVAVLSSACDPGVFGELARDAPVDAGSRTEATEEPRSGRAGSNTGGAPGLPQTAAGTGANDGGAGARSEASTTPPQFDAGSTPAQDAGAPPPIDASATDASHPEPDAAPPDAGPPDTGLPDTGSPDTGAPQPVGESACYERFASRLACEGFEVTQPEPPWWRIEEGGSIVQVGTPAYLGVGATLAKTSAVDGKAFIGRSVFNNLTSGKIYLRSYLYVPSGVPMVGVVVHGMSEGEPPYGGISVLLSDAAVQLDLHPNGPGVSPTFLGEDTPVPLRRDRWLCLQMEIGIGGAGSAKLSVDGTVAAVSTETIETLPPTGYRNISAGIVYTKSDQQPIQLSLDEVVADTSPIPCD
jgi:hypothetical protein